MKQTFTTCAISLILLGFNAIAQNKNQNTIMKQNNTSGRSFSEQVSVIDKITVPANPVGAFAEKSGYIRNFLKQQPGFIKDEAYQQKDEKGNRTIVTIATWANQDYLNNVKIAMQAEMKLNMPEFLKQHDIVMERGIYSCVEE